MKYRRVSIVYILKIYVINILSLCCKTFLQQIESLLFNIFNVDLELLPSSMEDTNYSLDRNIYPPTQKKLTIGLFENNWHYDTGMTISIPTLSISGYGDGCAIKYGTII